MNIKGNIVTLRAIEKEDLNIMREMLNDVEIERLVVGWSFPVSEYEQTMWYESNIKRKDNLRFIIETPEEGAVGIATLTNIDWKNRKATHGIKLANSKNRKRGIGTDTVMSIMRYAFDELQLNRLDGSILEDNIGSKKLYCDRCGWSVEGLQRDYIYKQGKYNNLIIVGILKKEYKAFVEINRYWEASCKKYK